MAFTPFKAILTLDPDPSETSAPRDFRRVSTSFQGIPE